MPKYRPFLQDLSFREGLLVCFAHVLTSCAILLAEDETRKGEGEGNAQQQEQDGQQQGLAQTGP